MKRLLSLELRKAFCSKWFLIALLIGIAFAGMCACGAGLDYYGEGGVVDFIQSCISNGVLPKGGLESLTLYNSWLGAAMNSVSTVFFYIVPLIAVLPCGWNISEEIHSGYLKVIIPRVGRRNYFSAKLIAAFTAGGAAIAITMLFSLAITAALLPAIAPKPYNNMYYWVNHGDLFSGLAFSRPLVYAMAYILIEFVLAGCFSCLSLVVALRSEKRAAALVIPYIAVLLCDALRNCTNYICELEISPLALMHSLPQSGAAKPWVLILWLLIFAAVILVGGLREGVKREIV